MIRFGESALRTPGFDWQNMLSLAMAAKYSYETTGDLEGIVSGGWNVEITAAADIGHTQGYVLESDHVAVLVYRGTESIGDWLTNITVIDTDGSLGEVHKGFFDSFDETKSTLIPPLQAASAAGKTVWMTGHSLGGAIALNAAIETRNSVNLAGLATFGQPRTIRNSAIDAVQTGIGANYFRFINDDDVVPRVPLLYFHAGQLFHFDGYGQLQENTAETETAGGLDQGPLPLTESELKELQVKIQEIEAMIKATPEADVMHEGRFGDFLNVTLEGLLPSIADHAMDQYLAAIRKFVLSETSTVAEIESIVAMSSISRRDAGDLLPHESNDRGNEESLIRSTRELDGDGIEFGYDGDFTGAEEFAPPVGAPHSIPATASEEKLPLLLETSSSWTPPDGLAVCSRYQQVTTVLATQSEMAMLANDGGLNSSTQHFNLFGKDGVLE